MSLPLTQVPKRVANHCTFGYERALVWPLGAETSITIDADGTRMSVDPDLAIGETVHAARETRLSCTSIEAANGATKMESMSWVSEAIEALRKGTEVVVRPRGGSMRGRIEDGQAVTLAPVAPSAVEVGDVVLVRWKGNVLLHLVKEADQERLLIGNNVGKINGWALRGDVLGRLVAVHPK